MKGVPGSLRRAGLWGVLCAGAWMLSFPRHAGATPPIVSGDVPTAPQGVYELFAGYLLTRTGGRDTGQVPGLELVYGVSERQEVNLKAVFSRRQRMTGSVTGFGDTAIGTKYRLFGPPDADAGLSVSAEVKLPTGNRARGLGSGAADFEVKGRAGWQVGREVLYVNLAHVWVGAQGDAQKGNVWFASGVWDHAAGKRVRLLTEVYYETADDPSGPDRLAGTVGIKWRVRPAQQFHFSVGRSLRAHARGGPDLRLYTGWRWDF